MWLMVIIDTHWRAQRCSWKKKLKKKFQFFEPMTPPATHECPQKNVLFYYIDKSNHFRFKIRHSELSTTSYPAQLPLFSSTFPGVISCRLPWFVCFYWFIYFPTYAFQFSCNKYKKEYINFVNVVAFSKNSLVEVSMEQELIQIICVRFFDIEIANLCLDFTDCGCEKIER